MGIRVRHREIWYIVLRHRGIGNRVHGYIAQGTGHREQGTGHIP